MGRYTNVQSYADNSPTMRTISYEQATGRASVAANTTNTDTRNEVEQPPTRADAAISSQQKSDDAAAAANSTHQKKQPTKSDGIDTDKSPQQQNASAAAVCDTNSLFVGGLHPRIGDLHLQKLFSPYGEIVRISIVTHNKNDYKPNKYATSLQQSSKGYAFVEYTNIESARLAITRLNGRQLMGRSLAVRPSRRKMADVTRSSGGGDSGKGTTQITAEEARREYGAVQSKIEAVKRAIEQKKRGM